MSQAPRAEMCKSASKIIIHHLWRLRPFWSSFPNQPLWDLVPRCEEWFLSRQCPSLCWMCPSFLSYLQVPYQAMLPHPKDCPQDYREGTHRQIRRILSASHFINSSIYVQVCHRVCMCVWRPETTLGVIFLEPSTLVFLRQSLPLGSGSYRSG